MKVVDSSKLAAAWQAFASGQIQQAERIAKDLLCSSPHDPQLSLLLGVACVRTGRLDEAVTHLKASLQAFPQGFDASNWLAFANVKLQNYEEAETYARRALHLQPKHADAWNNFGLGLFGLNRFEEAVRAFQTSIDLAPAVAYTYDNLGKALLKLERDADATTAFQKALDRGHRSASLYLRLSEIAARNLQKEPVIHFARLALQIDPTMVEPRRLMAWAFLGLGDQENAHEHIEEALRLESQNPYVMSTYGQILAAKGRFEDAKNLFTASIAIQSNQSEPYVGILRNGKVQESLRPLIKQAESVLETSNFSSRDRSLVHFALGKAHDDLKEFESAMSHFDRAHAIEMAKASPFLFDEYQDTINQLILRTPPNLQRIAAKSGLQTTQPIFIVGMMRSGTTLTEQIISSHPQVGGAGELGFPLNEVLLSGAAGANFNVEGLTEKGLAYLEKLDSFAPGALRVTDKMPKNYLILGKIHLAFPRAKIIHIRRNPVDTCLSIWMTPGLNALWSHGKDTIVFAYQQYLKIMDHWRRVLTPGAMLEIDYDQLVEDSETTIRTIIDFCELEWSEACLRHQDNEKAITTPSIWQARQPIYKSSLNRRDKYAPYLGEFAHLLN